MLADKPKILLLSFTSYLQKFYHVLPQEIVKQSEMELKLMVPAVWRELWAGKNNKLEKDFDRYYDIFVAKTLFTGNLHFALFRSPLKLLLKNFQPDIIDLENEPFNFGSFQVVRLRNKYSPHSKILLHASQNRFKNYPFPFNLIEKYVLKSVDAILVRNSMAKEILLHKGFTGKIEIIPHGVSTDAFSPRELPELCRQLNPGNELVLGYVGAMEKHKGVSDLIKAAAHANCCLLLVGDGKEKPALQQLAQHLGVKAIFTSSASHEEVAQFLNCMDIFVLPSKTTQNWSEKFGRVLIEAMASGLPVIGSACGEIPNVIGNCGLIFQENSIKDLRNKIKLLMADPKLRSELGWKARKRVIENFSAPVIARKTIQVYRNLLK